MNKKTIYIIILAIAIGLAVILLVRGYEDSWIKDKRGVWVKHGSPQEKPAEVTNQENLVAKALTIYLDAKKDNKDLSNGPCLGEIETDWALDVVNDPRKDIDDLAENQCADFNSGKAKHYIELDTNGSIVKIN